MVKRLVLFLSLMLLAGCSLSFSVKTQDEWLTAPLRRVGDTLVLTGPNLFETASSGNLYTYYDRGKWIALPWGGYHFGQNTWLIPTELKSEHSDWEQNTGWAIDFLGNRFIWKFFGANVGTSSK